MWTSLVYQQYLTYESTLLLKFKTKTIQSTNSFNRESPIMIHNPKLNQVLCLTHNTTLYFALLFLVQKESNFLKIILILNEYFT